MKLSDRGVNYEQKSMIVEVSAGEVIGKYRGHEWNYRYPRHMTQLQPKFLLYRSIAYSTRSPECLTNLFQISLKHRILALEFY